MIDDEGDHGLNRRPSSACDLVVRRKIDAVVYQVRKEIANACLDEADKRSEPPRDAYRPHV